MNFLNNIMGGCCSCLLRDNHKVVPTENVSTTELLGEETIPKPSTPELFSDGITKNRHCTDILCFLIFVTFILILIILISYCMSYGDINRIIYGYDDCGNICGMQNSMDTNLGCKGADRSNEPYLLIQNSGNDYENPGAVHRICVASCESQGAYKRFITRCISQNTKRSASSLFSKTGLSNFFQEATEDLHLCWRDILYLCLISFVFSIIILFLFRYIVGFIIWFVLIGTVIACISGTIFLWIKWKQERDMDDIENIELERTRSYFIYAILVTIFTCCVCLIILVLRKRIKLVIQLFKEAGKAVANMPFLLFEPILTFISIAVLVSLWIYFAIWIESAGVIKVESNASAKYSKDSTIKFTRWYNLFALFWISQFIIGCQHMVIAGAVATWFFTRNKSHLESPVLTSFGNLIRYHLGSVSFGSLLIAIIQFIRAIFKLLEYAIQEPQTTATKCISRGCDCCLMCLEKILQVITRNAYIEIAMRGEAFCPSGKRAFSILGNNALRVIAINSVGDFVLLLGKAFVVVSTVLIGMEFIQSKEGVHHVWVPLVLAGIFAYLISHCFITVYEMTIDTIFLCFCEDCEQNDGIARPYFMSRGLMEFVQNSKKVLNVHERSSAGNAWVSKSDPQLQIIKTVSAK